jgi:Arc/MetJ-type ribon-helix-helix transcriptional regulator
MRTLNVSMLAAMKAFVETQVYSGLYSLANDYIRTLIREGQPRRAAAMFAAQLRAACVAVRMQRL